MKGASLIVKPLTEYQETGANVSTLQCFFRNLPADGARLVDRVRGIEYAPAGATYDSSTHSVTTTHGMTDAVTALAAGTWPTFAANQSGLLVAAGRINLLGADSGPRFAIGDVNTGGRAGWGMAPAPFHSSIGTAGSLIRVDARGIGTVELTVVDTTTTFGTRPTITLANGSGTPSTSTIVPTMSVEPAGTGTIVSLLMTVDGEDYLPSGQILADGVTDIGQYSCTGQNVSTAGLDVILYAKYQPTSTINFQARNATTGALVLDGNIERSTTMDAGEFSPWAGMRFSGMDLYAAALFKFSGALPADVNHAAWWMGTSWMNNERFIWPGARSWQ